MAKFLLPLSLSLPEFFWWENGICLGKLLKEKWAKCGNPPGWNKGKLSLRLQEQMVLEAELRREGRGEGAGRQAGTPCCRRWETFPRAPTRQSRYQLLHKRQGRACSSTKESGWTLGSDRCEEKWKSSVRTEIRSRAKPASSAHGNSLQLGRNPHTPTPSQGIRRMVQTSGLHLPNVHKDTKNWGWVVRHDRKL